ncbi:MAG: hypothetical protein LC624_07970, partial [Halobacteriales archaeon]|nr:hypothetical protein [Halobacteriales archaeon]
MLVARAFVLGLNPRAGLAVAIVAMSVAYALVTGAAVHGLEDAGATLAPDLTKPNTLLALPHLAPFPSDAAPRGSVLLTHATWNGTTLGTVRPWDHPSGAAVLGAYAHAPDLTALGIAVDPGAAPDEGAPGDWVLVPPAVFDRVAPELAGKATLALAHGAKSPPGLLAFPAPAAGVFYVAGADQVFDSIHLVVLAMGLLVALIAGGVLRLEVLSRERDLATLEALGGASAARRAVVLRAVWLVGLGVGLGLGTGLAIARLLARAFHGPGVDVPFAAEVALVALAAGVLAGTLGGAARLRAPLAPRLGRRGPAARRFPGPVRFLLV